MGKIIRCSCSRCGHEATRKVGVGFLLFAQFFDEETSIIDKVKEGKYGSQGSEFFKAFPEGDVSTERTFVQCENCGELDVVPELTMYVPVYNEDGSTKESSFLTIIRKMINSTLKRDC